MGSSHRKKSRDIVRAGNGSFLETPGGSQPPERERAFLVGLNVRSRRGSKGAVTAQAAVAREAAALQAAPSGAPRSNGKPSIPEFDADESLAELRTLAESAGAQVVGEILQRRDRPDPGFQIRDH